MRFLEAAAVEVAIYGPGGRPHGKETLRSLYREARAERERE
jgi:hypothetical protein